MEIEDVTRELLSLAREGKVLTKCPGCASFLALEEIEAKSCDSCKQPIDHQDLLWYAVSNLPKA